MAAERLHEIPTSISLGSGDVSFLDVHGLFSATDYGNILLDRSRWGSFKPSWMSDDQFEELIGVDVNNLKHIQLTFATARVFLAYCEQPDSVWEGPVSEDAQFTDDEKVVLLLCAITHDWGEAVVGDIAQPLKTKASEKKEFKELRRIAKEVSGSNTELYEKISESIQIVLVDSNTKLSRAFNAIEKVGYHRTGLIGFRESVNWKGAESDMYDRLRGMAFSVHTHNLEDLIKYAAVYPPVLTQLIANADQISQIYETEPSVVSEILYRYQANKAEDTDDDQAHTRAVLEQKYRVNRDAWRAFEETQSVRISKWKDTHPGQNAFLLDRATLTRSI